MNSIRNQTPVKIDLTAGVPITRDIGCEFIFVERGKDLEIRAGGSRMTGRRAGDNIRLDGAVESFTVESPITQTIELVVGFGQFDRLIVEGQLSIAEYIKTLTGSRQTHGIDLEYHIGYDEWEPSVEFAGELIGEYDAPTSFGFDACCVYDRDNGKYYLFGGNGKFEVVGVDFTRESITDMASGYNKSPMNSPADIYANKIFFYSNDGFYRVDKDGSNLTSCGSVRADDPGQGRNRSGHGAFIIDGYFYLGGSINGVGHFEVYAIKSDLTMEWVFDCPFPAEWHANPQSPWTGVYYYHRERKIVINRLTSTICMSATFDGPDRLVSGGNIDYLYNSPIGDGNFHIVHWSDTENRLVTAVTHTGLSHIFSRAVNDREVQLQAYFWDGVDPVTKKYFWISGTEHIYFKDDGVVVVGDILGQIVRGLSDSGVSVLKDADLLNYRDYVTYLEYTDGRNVYKKDAGSASWAYANFNDRGELFIPSQVKLRVLPELLTNVY